MSNKPTDAEVDAAADKVMRPLNLAISLGFAFLLYMLFYFCEKHVGLPFGTTPDSLLLIFILGLLWSK